jgi:hypothetical protein
MFGSAVNGFQETSAYTTATIAVTISRLDSTVSPGIVLSSPGLFQGRLSFVPRPPGGDPRWGPQSPLGREEGVQGETFGRFPLARLCLLSPRSESRSHPQMRNFPRSLKNTIKKNPGAVNGSRRPGVPFDKTQIVRQTSKAWNTASRTSPDFAASPTM